MKLSFYIYGYKWDYTSILTLWLVPLAKELTKANYTTAIIVLTVWDNLTLQTIYKFTTGYPFKPYQWIRSTCSQQKGLRRCIVIFNIKGILCIVI